MNGAPFRAIGGLVVTDFGAIALADARALSDFYAGEAVASGAGARWRHLTSERARTLDSVARDTWRWRRAAGWADPDAADQA